MTEDPFTRVLEFVGDGDSLVAACKRDGMPSKSSVLRRVKADQSYAREYEAAIRERSEVYMHRHNEILGKIEEGRIDPSGARILLEGLRAQMTLSDRRLEGRQRIELTGADGRDLIPTKAPDDMEVARLLGSMLWRNGVHSLKDLEPGAPLLLEALSS